MKCILEVRVASALVVFTLAGFQFDEAYSANSDACKVASESAETWAVRACNTEKEKELDLQLARSWKRLMSDANQFDISHIGESHSGVTLGEQLDAEQKEWLRYRKTACSYFWNGNYFGEAGTEFNGPACIQEIVGQRIKYLDDADRTVNSAR